MSPDPRLAIRFCPYCGSGNVEQRVPRPNDRLRPVCAECGYVHYVGPVVAAGAILHDDEGRLCLVRRAHNPGAGCWSFPGGFVDLDEDPSAAALREVEEETGCRAELAEFVGVYRSEGPRGKQVVILVWSARALDIGGATDEEVMEVAWFEPDDVPWDEFAFESSRLALRAFLSRSDG